MIRQQADNQGNDAEGSWERALEVVDEYLERRESGEQPTLEHLKHRYPDLADAIQRILPVLSMLEDAVEIQAQPPDSSARNETTIPEQFGRYRVDRLIGKGAMGAVYLAHDTKLHRSVALKIARFTDVDAEFIERFMREARSMAKVEHPNLCPVFDVGEVEGMHFLAMAYIEGTSLADVIKSKTIFPQREAAYILMKLAQGLHVAHQAGIVHRDVKPSNVIIRSDNEPVLMDFGLAHRRIEGEAELTRDGAIVGSPAYMSPEQVDSDGARIGSRTDVYSLGVVLFEMLCGRRPFEGSTLGVLRDIKWAKPPSPVTIRADIDPRLEAICLKAMARAADNRFESAAELADALEQFLGFRADGQSGRDITATKQRRPRIHSLVTAAFLVLAFVGTATIALRRGPASYREETALPQETTTTTNTLARRPAPTKRHDASLLPFEPIVKAKSTGEFYIAQTLGGNFERQHVALADVDGDEDLDAFITSRSPEPLASRLWLNDGSGNFSDSGQRFEFDGYVYGLAFGDFDADGDFDAYVSCKSADTLLLNNGGVFAASNQQLNFPNTRRAALGDLDGDGDLDVYLPSEGFEIPDLVLTNDGKGHLADTGQRITAEPTRRATLGDFDGDGDLDVYRANLTKPDSLWLNDGNGYFGSRKRSFAAALESHGATVIDVDDDNDLDVLVADNQNPSRLWLNDGRANFTMIELPQLGIHATDFAMGDLNGDGVVDVWVSRGNWRAGYSTRPVTNRVWLRGDSLETGTTQDCGLAISMNAALGDLDGDGDLDAVVANHETPAEVWINRNIGELLPEPMRPMFDDNGERLGDAKSEDVLPGDLDSDGDFDVFVVNDGPNREWLNQNVPVDVHSDIERRDFSLATETAHLLPPSPIATAKSTGEFYDSGQRLGDSDSNAVQLGDLDGDGDLDAFVGCIGKQPNVVWFNDGSGRFTDRGQRLGQATTFAVSLGDLDGDGDLDAVASNPEADATSTVWFNDGTGKFTHSGPQRISANHVSLCDLDGDGDLDLFMSRSREACQVLWNDGAGRFTDSLQRVGGFPDSPPLSGRACSLYCAVGDVDNDDDLDVYVCGGRQGHDALYLNDGKGQFEASSHRLSHSDSTHVKLVDWNLDGSLDAVVAVWREPLELWLNDGTGRFRLDSSGNVVLSHNCVATGDIDGDSDDDLIAVSSSGYSEPVCVLRNSGDREFGARTEFGGLASGTSADIGDLDGDGDLDVYIACGSGGPDQVWFNRNADTAPKTPLFVRSPHTFHPSTESWSISSADFDGDHDLDLFTSGADPNKVWRNDGHGKFEKTDQFLQHIEESGTSTGDLDGDGDMDIFASSHGASARVWLNDGTGLFSPSQQQFRNGVGRDNVLADIDKDGDLDAIVAVNGQADNIWLNDGNANFSKRIELPGNGSYGVDVGDIDNDDDVDIVFSAYTAVDPLRIWLGNGKGNFELSPLKLFVLQSHGVKLSDFNNDGNLDLAVANTGNRCTTEVFFGDGHGGFKHAQDLAALCTISLASGDLDGDGDIDLVRSNHLNQPNEVLLNDGTGRFEHEQWLGATPFGSCQCADVDGDGDLDIIESHGHIWLNQTAKHAT